MSVTSQKANKAREYETIFAVDPTVDQAEVEKITSRVADVISKLDGKLAAIDNWGRRKLAYRTDKKNRGYYMYLRYYGQGGLVAEIERNLRMQDTVFRFQTNLLADEVDLSAAVIDEEKIQFRRVEIEDNVVEQSIEQRLGLVQRPRPSAALSPSDDVSESDDDFEEDSVDSDADSSDDSGLN
ncbi:MAG: 30S ribosomal protein S6 [Myxococcales bacterium]|nr:MAG: 30S ribosomal protein S6 [Myxococcales bacterium]